MTQDDLEHVQVGDLEVGFRRAGAGPALVLLHGAVSDGRVWKLAIDALSDDFTVVAWDAPGCGGSSDPPDDFRMPDYADSLARFIEAVGLHRPHVLGHSWGSTLALELCLRHPALVDRLILVGGYAGWAGSLSRDEVERRLAFALAAADEVEDGGWDPRSMPGLFSDAMSIDRAEDLAGIMGDIRAPATRAMAHALAEADLRHDLGHIDAPTLVVCGDEDERSPVEVSRALEGAIPDATLSVLPGVGHECYLEDPDLFHAVVRGFLHDHRVVPG